VPIAASDPVTYVITATSFFTYNEDTATVVIAVGISDINKNQHPQPEPLLETESPYQATGF
jgi:hypothetical protein